jgi:CheY-like chemotaxis protein
MPYVLIVDDDASIRDTLTMFLEDEDFSILQASNGKIGLELLQEVPHPCVVVLDRMMPVLSGDDVLRHVVRSPDLQRHRFLLSTAVTENIAPDVFSIIAQLRIPIMRKPFEITDLLDSLRLLSIEIMAPVQASSIIRG